MSNIHQTVKNVKNKCDLTILSFAISFRKEVSNFEIRRVIGKESGSTPSCAGGATPAPSPCCDSLHLLLGSAYLARSAGLCTCLQYRAMCNQGAHDLRFSER
jgi:hypothetical protein